MPWARFEDRYPFNRKVRPLSDAAFRLDVSGICWSAAQLTDGIISADDLEAVSSVKRPRTAVKHLIARGRWHELQAVDNGVCETCADRLRARTEREPAENGSRTDREPTENPTPVLGWIIHDFLLFNPSRKKVLAEREAKAKRQVKWLEARRRDASRDASQDVSGDAAPDASYDASLTPSETPPPPRPAPPRRKRGGGPAPSAGPARQPSGPPGPATFRDWCGNCSDPNRRLVIDSETGNVTLDPCPQCHQSRPE